jgi:hypothetical protein
VFGARHKGPDILARRLPSEQELWEPEEGGDSRNEELKQEIDGVS